MSTGVFVLLQRGNLIYNTKSSSTSCSSSYPCLCQTVSANSFDGTLIAAKTSTDCAGFKCTNSDASTCCKRSNRRLLRNDDIQTKSTKQPVMTTTISPSLTTIPTSIKHTSFANISQANYINQTILTNEICDAWLGEQEIKFDAQRNYFSKILSPFHEIRRMLNSACTAAQTEEITTCVTKELKAATAGGDDACKSYQAMYACYPACYCDDANYKSTIDAGIDALKEAVPDCALKCGAGSAYSDGVAKSSGGSSSGTNGGKSNSFCLPTTNYGSVIQGLLAVIVVAWIRDLCILRSMLDTSTVELESIIGIVPSEWSEPWACFLNNQVEANLALKLLRRYSRSYNR